MIQASHDLENLDEEDSALVREAESVRSQLAETRLGADGRVLEWNDEFIESDPQHRHLSHLYELHPGAGITSKTPRLEEPRENPSKCVAMMVPVGASYGA